jgi:hypothetical protein
MDMTEKVSPVEYGKFFDKVLKLDENIRFVAIYDGQLSAKFKEGIQGYFKEEEIKSSLSEAQKRWTFRKKLSFKIGEPKFAMAEYAKVNRITFPLDNDGIILVTTELGVDVSKLVDKIIEIRYSINKDFLAGFYTR